MANIALQLYTVRDIVEKQGYEMTVRKVAEIGYRYVENAGFPGTTPQAAAKLYKEVGLTVVAAHIGNPVGDAKNQVLETLAEIGATRLVVPWIDPKMMATEDGIKGLCDLLNEGGQTAREHGLQFGYHNHWAEFGKTEDGQYVYQLMAKYLHPQTFFELDTYWIKVAGVDPAAVVKEMGKRAPLLHIKDGPGNHEDPMTAVGEGIMDWPKLLKAAGTNAENWIVEMDRVAGDSMEEARKSFQYLKNLKV